ncbi:Alpha/Beta hydrolase protein [Aspergillus californicus]
MPSLAQNETLSSLADLKLPRDIHISPDGKKALYTLESFSRKNKPATSSLWIADIGVDHSARQITSGLSKDEKAKWSPDGRSIAFLSDRRSRQGEVYLLEIGGFGEAYPLLQSRDESASGSGINGFEWSGDGRFIAFLSEDGNGEITTDEVDLDGPLVFGGEDENTNQRLRVIDVKNRILRTLTPAEQDIAFFSWSPDPTSHEIAYTISIPDTETDTKFTSSTIAILSTTSTTARTILTTKTPITALTWTQRDKLHFIARPSPPYTTPSVYEARIKSKQYGSYFGWTGDAVSLTRTRDSVIARIQHGSHESAHALGVESVSWPFPSFFTSEYEISSFDAVRDAAGDGFTLVVARSSPTLANEVWSVRGSSFVKLSSHNSAFDGFRSRKISSGSEDGWECDGWLFSPKPSVFTLGRGLPPTVVLIQGQDHGHGHGSPQLPSFSTGPHLDVAYLTSAGYAVLCPIFRQGDTGLGERYSAVIAILKKAVSENLVDESRVTISGWSDGGFLASLAVIRNEFNFRAVVCGGGVVDWEFVRANQDEVWPGSDIPSFSDDANADADADSGYEEDRGRSGREIEKGKEKKKTPLLILHGQDDEHVPVSGPLGFWRQRQRWNGPVQMVLYPKEKHVIRDRKHLVDLWTRVLGFYERYLL